MRFFKPEDESKLTVMVAEGAVSRETLEKAVGDRTVSLFEALIEHGDGMPVAPWLSWGVRKGHARVNNTRATAAFIRDLKLGSEALRALANDYVFPFAKNAYGQVLVATFPGSTPTPDSGKVLGDSAIHCIASLAEMRELRAAFLSAK